MKTKVLHFSESIKGGVSTYLDLFDDVLNEDVSSSYLVPISHANFLKAKKKYTYSKNSRSIFSLISLYFVLRNKLKFEHYDLLFVHSSFAGVVGCVYKLLNPSVTLIYCPHGWASFQPHTKLKTKLYRLIDKIMSYIPDVVVNISEYEHNITKKLGFSKKCVLIANAVEDLPIPYNQPTYNIADDGIVKLLFIGRLDEQKGIDTLLSVIEKINNQNFRFQLTIVGDYVLNNTKQFDLDLPWIRNIGWVENSKVNKYVSESHCVVVPSRWEGFGLVVLEAFRNSRCVITSNAGNLPILVNPPQNGFVFESEEELKQILQNIDVSDLKFRGENARKAYLKGYSPKQFSTSYKKVLNKFIQSKSTN